MKDSGVEWIGEIPEHWEVKRLKRILKIPLTDGPHTTPLFMDDGIPSISAAAIHDNQIDFSKQHFVSEADHLEFCKKAQPKRNDILLVKAGNTTGRLAIVNVDFDFSIWSPLALIRINGNNYPKFFYMLMQSIFFQNQISVTVNWNTQPNIGMNDIRDLKVIVPPKEEQKQIDNFLQKETTQFDDLISKSQSQIKILQEKRQALITSAVTGKIDVRNGVAA